ncbi:MAG: SufBD protein [Clostridia bacterium]
MDIQGTVARLRNKNLRDGCAAMEELIVLSRKNDEVYRYKELFLEMIEDKNSYIRTRGLLLLIAVSPWDSEGFLRRHIHELLSHITDEKPITARQFIGALPDLAAARPELKPAIRAALSSADVSFYADTMAPLVRKDIGKALAALDAGEDNPDA